MNQPAQPTPEVSERVIKITKTKGGKWSFNFDKTIKMRDVNHIRNMLRVEFNRMKRRSRLQKRSQERLKKEAANAA